MTQVLIRTVLPVLLFGGAFFAATYQLTESPALWYDEGFFMQAAMNVAERGEQVMRLGPTTDLSSWSISAGYPLILPIAGSLALFGEGVLQARGVMVLYVMLFLGAAYLYARRQWGATTALAALALLATFPLLYGNGKAVLGEVPALFYLMLTLLSLQALQKSEYTSKRAWVFVGICAGLTFAAKYMFVLVLPALGLAFFIKHRAVLTRTGITGALLASLAFLIPVAVWFHFQFGPNDSLASVLTFFANPYENTAAQALPLILSNVLRFFTEATPLYLLLVFVPWKLSLFLRMRGKELITLAEIAAFAFTVLVLLAYLWSPGWYRYFFGAFMVALLFFPYAAIDVFRRLSSRLSLRPRIAWLPYAIFAVLVVFHTYQLAFHSYVQSYYGATRTAELEQAFSALSPDDTAFLYNVPEVAVLLPTHEYYQYVKPHESQNFGAEELPLLAQGVPDIVIANAGTYLSDPTPFVKYQVMTVVSHYVILSRI